MNGITKYSVLLIVFAWAAIGLFIYLANAQSLTPNNSFDPIDVRDGAGLYKKQLANGNAAYLQLIDLRKTQIDQLIGETEEIGEGQGLYYRGANQYRNPFFKRKLFSEVADSYVKTYTERVFSIINCAFFEQYQPATQLSFPVKINGQVIAGGNSPYGPIEQPKDPRYKNIRLKALVWDDRRAYVTDYDPQTGKPLSETEVKNAIVTYKYSDHPAKILANDRTNRYHVMATLDRDGNGGDELLAIITVNKATLEESANLLRELGAPGDIIAIDGGTSVYLFNSKVGNIMLPQSGNGGTRELPHYLGFRTRLIQKED
ncbi:MAG: hypothetical protein MUE44_20535 [Oscillatoriaceae cyanobacterium Prado104]|jgi:hypothetical protein|nr:hypothetical protein [Oscillatoriaceae cyanobacterium Prado104]